MTPTRPVSEVPPDGVVDLLVLAAHAPELVGLRPHIGDALHGHVGALFVVAKTVGIGLAVVGAATLARLTQLKPRAVVVVGSCGVYPGPHPYQPLDVIVPSRLTLFDPSVSAGKAAFPEPMQTVAELDPTLADALVAEAGPRGRTAEVATTMAITTDDAVARVVHDATGLEAENLELFPMALACKAQQVPFAAVLSVTNVVGSKGRADWRQYQRDAAVAAAEVVVRWARAGARGLPARRDPTSDAH
ncbi:MAG: hypothetical protein ABW252_12405 [Polyangiales bacterium]